MSHFIKPTGVWRLDQAFAPLPGHRGLPIPASFTFQYPVYADDNKCWHHRPSATPVSNNMRYNFSMCLLFSASFDFVRYFCHTCMCMGEITCIYRQMLEEGIYRHLLWLFTLFLNTGYSSKSKACCSAKDGKDLPVSATQCWVTGMVPIFWTQHFMWVLGIWI